jgi:hypothetical protein
MEKVGDREGQMERDCSTGQSPQRALAPTEEEKEEVRVSSYIQMHQPTRCNNLSSLLLDFYLRLNVFRASLRPSSGTQQLQ